MLWGSLQHPIWAQGKSLVYKLFAGDLAADYGSFDAILPVIPLPARARRSVWRLQEAVRVNINMQADAAAPLHLRQPLRQIVLHGRTARALD